MTRFPRFLKAGLLASVFTFGLVAAGSAEAQRHHGGGHAHFGLWVGGPLWWPGYGYGYGYGYGGGYPYYPSYPQAPIVIQQQPAEPAVTMVAPSAAQSATWYYCRDSKMYYPYASECASPWQEVPATPPAPPNR